MKIICNKLLCITLSLSPTTCAFQSSHVKRLLAQNDPDKNTVLKKGLVTVMMSSQPQTDVVDISNLPLPPMKGGFLRRFRDTIGYVLNPDEFISKRSAQLNSPVFQMYQFFKPTVVVGGQQAVSEFISGKESSAKIIYPALPDSFKELHTKWGSLNLDINDITFQQARSLFADVLSSSSCFSVYMQTIEPMIDEYVNELAERVRRDPEGEYFLVPEVKELCLQIFSTIFSGQGLSKEQVQLYDQYNSALLSLSTNSDGYTNGANALKILKEENLRRFKELSDPSLDNTVPGKFYYNQVNGREGFEDEDRIGTGILLFVWGAYIECCSLMINALTMINMKKPEVKQIITQEFKAQKSTGMDQTDYKFWKGMPYTTGVLRESLRLEAPGAGVPRFGNEDFQLAGYRIPAKMPVMMDPRIGNNDPNLFTNPETFEPYRWVANDRNESKCPLQGTALKLGAGSWFPGGNGAHKCPGIPLAEIVSSIFVAKMSERFEWTFSGSGLNKDGSINYVKIPVKICPDNMGLKLELVTSS